MDHSLRLLARMIVRRHFASQAPGAQGRSNGAVMLRDAPDSGSDNPIIDGDDLLSGRTQP